MSEILNLYPVLTPLKISKAEIMAEDPELSYTEEYEDYPLILDEKNESSSGFTARLKDERCVWYPETHNLVVRLKGYISHPDMLFGANGIAPHDAVIGIAGIWSSRKSDLHGTIRLGEFSLSSSEYRFEQKYTFKRNIIRGSLRFQIILYLKKKGNPYSDEFHLANQSGIILGTIGQCEIFVDGNGTVFPVATVNEPGKPLWWVNYDSSADPFDTPFDEEYVEIRLNSAHPCFADLKIDESLKTSPLFLEVISSALYIIVMSARAAADTEWEDIQNGNNLMPGTIAAAVSYFINKLEWDTSDPSSLARSIHDYFDKNL